MTPVAVSPTALEWEANKERTREAQDNSQKIVAATTIPNGIHIGAGELDASKLTITRNPAPRHVPASDSSQPWEQTVPTDHMLTCKWSAVGGWEAPEIRAHGPLSFSPLASVLQYATECFEGLKAYRGYDGKVRLFRPQRNAARFVHSATRVSLPAFSPTEFLKLLKAYVGVEAPRWLPDRGRLIYLRPTLVGTSTALGITAPTEALLIIVAVSTPAVEDSRARAPPPAAVLGGVPSSTVNGAPPAVPQPGSDGKPTIGTRLIASREDMVRAWPGGFGNAKLGANYGPSMLAQQEGRNRGYHQVLWLFGEECVVTEAGGSNFFVLWKTREGQLELVTAPLGEGIILPGVTRQSVIDLVHERFAGEIELVERRFTMYEVATAAEEGRLLEAFACGTAVFVSPCAEIHFRSQDIALPLARGEPATYSLTIRGWLKDIMYGNVAHPWGVVVDEQT